MKGGVKMENKDKRCNKILTMTLFYNVTNTVNTLQVAQIVDGKIIVNENYLCLPIKAKKKKKESPNERL